MNEIALPIQKFKGTRYKRAPRGELTSLSLGEEILIIPNQPMVEEKGLFENKLWLWILMTLAIVIMGGFTLKMLRSER
ncbi:hypothetical protein [Nonlabens tegetincola]|uniref:hypothetical protein n=1 Tax=Nonlabens tegetincola TaxID=323273 RepID=UPI0011AFF2B5|nr:hypothetical protein [Nonlabens tegetincola]